MAQTHDCLRTNYRPLLKLVWLDGGDDYLFKVWPDLSVTKMDMVLHLGVTLDTIGVRSRELGLPKRPKAFTRSFEESLAIQAMIREGKETRRTIARHFKVSLGVVAGLAFRLRNRTAHDS